MKTANRPRMMQRNVPRPSRLLTVLPALTLSLAIACSDDRVTGALSPAINSLRATDLGEMQRLHISDGPCAEALRYTLNQHGLEIARDGLADARLSLSLSRRRPLRESLPLIESLGIQAQYRADILGANEAVLLSIFGQEGSLSFNEFCEDIGDEIADRIAAAFAELKNATIEGK